MKRVLTIFLLVVSAITLFGFSNQLKAEEEWWDYIETFENVELPKSYGNGDFKGVGDINWEYGHSRDQDTFPISDKGLMLRRASDSYLEANFPNGIGSFYFEFRKAYTGSSERELEVIVNDKQFDTSVKFGTTSNAETTVHSMRLEINLSGEVKIKIKNIGDTATNRQVTIDNIAWTEFKISGLDATINQLIDEDNQIPTQISGEYGQDIQIPVANEVAGSEFKFALVNGVIRNDFVVGNNTIPMYENLEVALVYSKEDKHAVLFIDSNGKLIDNLWVENGEDAIAPNISELSKPGYVVSSTAWLSNEGETSLTGIDSSRVYQLQYESTKPTVTITVNDVEFEYEYNQVVTLESTNENFTSWVDEDGIVLSTSKIFKFTALVDREIKESTTVVTELPVVTMTKDLKLRPSADQLQTFVGQIELRDGDVLVEHGLLLTKDGLLRDTELTVSNATKARSNVLVPGTNEFMLSVNEEYLVVRAYVIVRNSEGELETFYSEVQYDDVAIVTFDTDGSTIIEQVAIKKGTKVTEPVEPTKPSYEFIGWFVSDEEFLFDTNIFEDITIVAMWKLLTSSTTVTASYSGPTKNMTSDNNAAIIKLDSDLFTVTSIERDPSPLHVGLNSSGQIRLYGASGRNGNELIIRISNEFVITKVEYSFGSNVGDAIIKMDDIEVFNGALTANSNKSFDNLNVNSFSIKNTNDNKNQIYILSIKITYHAK